MAGKDRLDHRELSTVPKITNVCWTGGGGGGGEKMELRVKSLNFKIFK